MDALSAGDLTIDVDDAGEALRFTWRGKSNARNPSQVLLPYFARILEDPAHPKRPLELAFERLEHFNSSTISALIQLIHSCRARGTKLLFTFDARVKWQKLGFEALRVLAKADGLLEVRAIG